MGQPTPKKFKPYLAAIETYIVEKWLPSYPHGAKIRKLQRDIAFRMKPDSPGKLPRNVLDTIVGDLHRRGVIGIRDKGQSSSVIVITKPFVEEDKGDDEDTGNGEGDGTFDSESDDDDSSSDSDDSDYDSYSSDSDDDVDNSNPPKS